MGKGKYHRSGGQKDHSAGRTRRSRQGRDRGRGDNRGEATVWIYGLHAVAAALANPQREMRRLLLTQNAADALRAAGVDLPDNRELSGPEDIGVVVGPDAVHQGVALEATALPQLILEDVAEILDPESTALVVVLDQVTDPHNVGAIFRSAAAFGAAAIVTQDRHSPPETGSLAKAASGGLEAVPWVRVTNLARALDRLAELGIWRVGLDGEAETELAAVDLGRRIALVLGSEGKGMRLNSRAHCDALARLPISDKVESLNVSNAAAVALYALTQNR